MRRAILFLLVFLLSFLVLTGCSCTPVEENKEPPAKTDDDMFTAGDSDTSYDAERGITITLNGDSITASTDDVSISGTTATITKEGTYIVSGTLNRGKILVTAPSDAEIRLVLKNASITSTDTSALAITKAQKVLMTLEGENALTTGSTTATVGNNAIDGALYSKPAITLNGNGSLSLTAVAGSGIACKSDLVITGGTYTIASSSHAIDANDSVRIKSASVTTDAGMDGIHAENTTNFSLGYIYISGGKFNIEAEGDGVSAGAYMQIGDGEFKIIAGGGHTNGKTHSDGYGNFPGMRPGGRATTVDSAAMSMKGLKATDNLLVTGGTYQIDAADDALHTNSNLTVSGGTYTLSSGDDGLHADDSLTVSGGTIDIITSYEGMEAIHIAISNGTIKLIATDDGLNAAGGNDTTATVAFPGTPNANANGSVKISGGTLHIQASGDGIDANGTLEISGGYITVTGPTTGDTATLDYDKTGIITGGTFVGTGAYNPMAQTFSDAEQGVLSIRVDTMEAGTVITLSDADGNVLLTHTPALAYQVVIITTPDMKSGETYTVSCGTVSESFVAN